MKFSNNKYNRVKYGCYATNLTMSAVACLSPILFLTFKNTYEISFSLLGVLILVNYSTQLLVDLVFSLFSHKFNINLAVKMTPMIALVGFLIFSFAPDIFPTRTYLGLLLGTVIFSAASGFSEVLITPVIAAIPSDNTDREVAKLHSVYAFGVVAIVVFSALFLHIFSNENWQWLSLMLCFIPFVASVLYFKAEMPPMVKKENPSSFVDISKKKGVWICVLLIFLGGAAECTMFQWASTYIEAVLELPKLYGDIFGVAIFSLLLGLGRALYSKYGKNIDKILLLCSVGSVLCYVTATLTLSAIVGIISCFLTGFCTSMLWPGNLIYSTDRFSDGGVPLYALMAAGGDAGASFCPLLVGVITDYAITSPELIEFSYKLGITSEQLGMKLGLLIGAVFPMVAIPIYLVSRRKKSKD